MGFNSKGQSEGNSEHFPCQVWGSPWDAGLHWGTRRPRLGKSVLLDVDQMFASQRQVPVAQLFFADVWRWRSKLWIHKKKHIWECKTWRVERWERRVEGGEREGETSRDSVPNGKHVSGSNPRFYSYCKSPQCGFRGKKACCLDRSKTSPHY